MAREIKFRAFSFRHKEMLMGVGIMSEDQRKKSALTISGDGIMMNPDNLTIEDGYALMQYTGLKDRNGKEIFEGDVLSNKWKVEVYQQDDGLWMVKHHAYPDRNKPKALKVWLRHRYQAGCPEDNEIIGNVHQNPELLPNP